jgi:hypothetical protein
VLALALLTLGSVSGCYESHDLRFELLLDGGGPDLDAADAATPARDAAILSTFLEDGAAAASDAACASELVPPYGGPGCAPLTAVCLGSCLDETCLSDCYAADPECLRCANEELVSCANAQGCQPAWDALACCTTSACPGTTAPAPASPSVSARLTCAASGPCVAELRAYSDCVRAEALRACEPRVQGCLR